MDIFQLIILAVVGLVAMGAILVVAVLLLSRRRTRYLRDRFGLEYDYTTQRMGDRRRAEAELAEREKKVKSLPMRHLSREEVERASAEWLKIQAHFVDAPAEAVSDADLLVSQVAELKGYPPGDLDHRVSYISVNHPAAAQHYRAAHQLIRQNGHSMPRQETATENLRRALNHYQEVLNDLLDIKAKEKFQWQRTTNRPI